MYSYKTKPCRFFALNICRYGSRCYFRHDHIHKSQDWAVRNFKALEQKINEQIQNQLEFQERMEKKIDEILQYQLELRKLSQNIPQCTIPQGVVNDYLQNEPIAQKRTTESIKSEKKTQIQASIPQSPVHPDEQKPCGLSNCTKQAKLRCTKCKKTYYCSPKHQAEHWKCHKKQCGQDARDDKHDFEFSGNTLTKEIMNMVEEFNIPGTDTDFRSLLKEIEDDELREIVI